MNASRPPTDKKFFTVTQANQTLPLVRAIVRDVTELAQELRQRHERLNRFRAARSGTLSEAHQEELEQAEAEFERLKGRLHEYETELEHLGVELKDYFLGLIDFPAWINGRAAYLCWRLGETEVAHWHDLDAGFAGRRKLQPDSTLSQG